LVSIELKKCSWIRLLKWGRSN